MTNKNEITPCRCHACVALALIEADFNPAKYSNLDTLGAVVALGLDSEKLDIPARSLSKIVSFHLAAARGMAKSLSSQNQLLADVITTFTNYAATEKAVAAFSAQVHTARNDASFQTALDRYEARKATPEGKHSGEGRPAAKTLLEKDLETILKGVGVVMEKPGQPGHQGASQEPANNGRGRFITECGHPECQERADRMNAGNLPDPRFLLLDIGPVSLPFLLVQQALETVYKHFPELRPGHGH